MKVEKINQVTLKSSKGRKLASAKRKKRDLSKITTEEFLEQNFEYDSDTDNDNDNSNKNIGNYLLFYKIFGFPSYFKLHVFIVFYTGDENYEHVESE